MRYRKKPSIFEVNLLFLLLGISLLTIGGFVQTRELFSGLLITEYILILVPCLLFLKIKRVPIKETLRLNKIGLKQIILAIVITIFTYPLAVFLQAIFIGILNIFKDMMPTTVPMPNDEIQYLISFFIIAITPGICEEIMFRGVIMDAYSRLGYRKSIIISALLFGIFHFNLMNFVGPTILGVVFGIMVYKTNSIYSSIIAHTTNNGIALTIGFFLNKYQEEIDGILMEPAMVSETASIGIGSIILPFIFLVCCFLMVKILLGKLEPVNKEKEVENNFLFDSPVDIESAIEDLYNYEDASPKDRRLGKKYLPVVIVIFIFVLINWLYFFL
ncbi:MAG: CPBP family intramembrane metalloprotease [Tissierella sp.]|nr:CPBP family intramembrane metalloprotease [Tissierella sp.]